MAELDPEANPESKEATPETPEKKMLLSEIKALPEDLDEDGFVSLWNIASASCDGDVPKARELASKLLCFLCRKNCDFVVTSSTNAQYLDERFERDKKVLYDWKPESENVDIVAQHAEVPYEPCMAYLANQKFDPGVAKYTATRAARVEWFKKMWCVG